MINNKKNIIIYLLLTGLAFHDFFKIESFKFFDITITYLRVALALSILLLLFTGKKLEKNDIVLKGFIIFAAYGLTRICGNYREFLNIYCVLVSFILLYAIINDKITIQRCINCLATIFIFFCIYGIIEIITGYHYVETYFGDENVKMLATGMYFNENDFSAYLSVMIFYMLLSRYNKYMKITSITVALIIIAINRSLICILGIISLLIFYWIFKKKDIIFKKKRIAITISGIVFMTIPIIKIIQNSSWYWRLYMYKYGVLNCLDNFLLGTGIGNYEKGMISVGYTELLHSSANPHCFYLELAGEFGMIWLILIIVLLGYLIKHFSNIENQKNKYYIGLIYMFSFVGMASSSCLEKNYIYLALLLPLLVCKCNDLGCEYNDERKNC